MTNRSFLHCDSLLCDEKSFYPAFLRDLEKCRKEVIIESPFITSERMKLFHGIFTELYNRGVRIFILTRDPLEHDEGMDVQSEEEIRWFESVGIQTLLCQGNHHRKLAILDRTILWEGSLNILSQSYSREIMRRLESEQAAIQMVDFLKLEKFLE